MTVSSKDQPLQLEHPGGSVRVVQLTDCHLSGTEGGTLLGMDTDHSLQAVIDQVKTQRDGIDMLLGTGDLSDHGAAAAYLRVHSYFAQLSPANFWLPGNHDDRAAMSTVAGASIRLSPEIRIGKWQVLMLDSQIPGAVGGQLGEQQLLQLEHSLAAAKRIGLHTLVCLHHQPIAIGCAWLDGQMVADTEQFFDILDAHSGVKGVLWGHVHQEVDVMRKGVRLLATPSTCVQFAPNCEEFKVDDKAPGYRWLELLPDGVIETGVSRVETVHFSVDLNSGGYL